MQQIQPYKQHCSPMMSKQETREVQYIAGAAAATEPPSLYVSLLSVTAFAKQRRLLQKHRAEYSGSSSLVGMYWAN
jgi:hypothetical protein